MGAPSNSYRRGRCNGGRGVSFGGRTTSFYGWQKGAEGRRSTMAPCRGGSNGTHTPSPSHPCSSSQYLPLCFTNISLSLPFSHSLTLSPNQHHETLESKGGGTPTPGTVINRGLYRWRCADGGWDLWFRWAHLRTTWLAPFYLCPSHKLENRRRRRSLEGFVLTVQSFSCGRPLTSRGQVYKPGTPSVKKEDRGGW